MNKNIDILRKQTEQLIYERKKALGSASLVISELERIITGFHEGESMLTFEQLELIPMNEIQRVNESVEFLKTYHDDDKMVFITYMQEGGSFGLHSHDCVERCKIIEGSLIERTRGYKVYHESEEVWYSANEKHKPYAERNSTYEVTFFKTIN